MLLLASAVVSIIMGQFDDAISITVVSSHLPMRDLSQSHGCLVSEWLHTYVPTPLTYFPNPNPNSTLYRCVQITRGYPNIGLSEQRVYQNKGLSKHRIVRTWDCRSIGLSEQTVCRDVRAQSSHPLNAGAWSCAENKLHYKICIT